MFLLGKTNFVGCVDIVRCIRQTMSTQPTKFVYQKSTKLYSEEYSL